MIANTRVNGAVGYGCGDRRVWDGDGVQNLQYQKPKWQSEGLLKSSLVRCRRQGLSGPLAVFSDGNLFPEARTWPS